MQKHNAMLTPLAPELINTHANVIVGQPAAKLLKSFYTVEGVNAENHDIHTAEYKTILREALPRERCPQYSSSPKAPIQIAPSTPTK